MSIPSYTTRERVAEALDFRETAHAARRIDRSVRAATEAVHGMLRRRFYPTYATRTVDYPDRSSATYDTIYLDGAGELISADSVISGGSTIAEPDRYLRPDNGPPYDRIVLPSSAWIPGTGAGYRSVSITGLWGHSNTTEAAGALSGGVNASTTTWTVTAAGSAAIGVGDLLERGSERVTVVGRTQTDTGQNLGANLAASMAADAVSVGSGVAFAVGEIITIGTERMLVLDILGNALSVVRAYDGSTLAAHTAGADVYAPRALTVARGAVGTSAATQADGAAVLRWVPPALICQLATAEAQVMLVNEGAAYARTAGAGENQRMVGASQLKMLRDQACAEYRRPWRKAAV